MTLIEALGLAEARLVALVGAGGKTSLLFALAQAFADAGDSVLVTTTTRLAAEEVTGAWPEAVASDADEIAALAPRAAGAVVVHAGVDSALGKAIGLDPDVLDRVAVSGRFGRVLVEADGAAHRPLKVPAAHEPVVPVTADAVIAVAGLSAVGRAVSDETVFRGEAWSRITGLAAGDTITADAVARAAGHPDGLAKGAPAMARRVLVLNQADAPGHLAAGRAVARRLADTGRSPFARVVLVRLRPAPEVVDTIVLDRRADRST